MRKLLPLLGLLLSTSVFAADNALIVTPGAGVTMRTIDVGALVQAGTSVPVGTNGVAAWGTAGTANANILTVQGIASMTPILATVTGTVTANQGGTWTARVVGNAGATIDFAGQNASSPANSWLTGCQFNTSPTAITSTNSSPVQCDTNGNTLVNVKALTSWAGGTLGAMANYGTSPGAVLVPGVNAFVTNTNANGQATMANSSPVTLASNQSVADPCTYQAKTNLAISTATGTTGLVTGVSAKKIYVCSIVLVTPTAVSVSLSEGSSATCGTSSQAAVIGVATNGTAANGMPFAANGGLTLGTGHATVASTATAANALCLFQSGTAQIAGNITYVQQ